MRDTFCGGCDALKPVFVDGVIEVGFILAPFNLDKGNEFAALCYQINFA